MTSVEMTNGYLPAKPVSPWRGIVSAICYFLLYLGLQFIFSAGYSIYLIATLPLEGLSEAQQTQLLTEASYRDGNILMILLDVVLFLILSIIFLARGKKFSHAMGMKKTRIESVLLAILVGVGLSCALNFVMILIEVIFPGIMEDYSATMDVTYNMQEVLLYFLAGVVGAPLLEELIFRHLITGRLANSMPRILAILIGAVVFGLVHGHPVQWVYAGVLGIVMACAYFAYDSIWVPIAIHAGFNSLSLLACIDTSKMSEAALQRFSYTVFRVEQVLALAGIIALIILFLRRKYPVFRDPKRVKMQHMPIASSMKAAATGSIYRDLTVNLPSSGTNGIPSVADLTASLERSLPAPLTEAVSETSAANDAVLAEMTGTDAKAMPNESVCQEATDMEGSTEQ